MRRRADQIAVLTEDTQAALDTLPLVERGLITFELIALTPCDGFARLFAGDA